MGIYHERAIGIIFPYSLLRSSYISRNRDNGKTMEHFGVGIDSNRSVSGFRARDLKFETLRVSSVGFGASSLKV